jgi:formate hydrogenlyase transcriptional activator
MREWASNPPPPIDPITKMEKEKTLLLSFSDHLATVRDLNGLRCIIKQFLKQVFQISEYILTLRNADNKTYSYFLHDLMGDDPTDEGFRIISGTKIPISGSLTGAVLRLEEPIVFCIKDIIRSNRYSFPCASFWKAAGAEHILGIRLRVGQEDVAMLWIQAGRTSDRLLRGVCAQIAIALANALANQEIDRQGRELKKFKKQMSGEDLSSPDLPNAGRLAGAGIEGQLPDVGCLPRGGIVGGSPAIQKVHQLLSQVAFANTTVLVLGETGTGKELIARAIHNASPRAKQPLIKVNCAAIPAQLIESELFGHECGSFTGAIERKIGKFELANNGTLFLDEIGEMPPDMQVKLLRAIQEREIERVGGKGSIKVNVRIVAATNRDLQQEVIAHRFRSDLYYRLNVFPIHMPPLRERAGDILSLAEHFIAKLAATNGKIVTSIAPKCLQELMGYKWPGNVRELENLLERALLMTTGPEITHVPLPDGENLSFLMRKIDPKAKSIDDNERDHIVAVLKKCYGKVSGPGGAAESLGIPASTLNSKMRKLGIKKERVFSN